MGHSLQSREETGGEQEGRKGSPFKDCCDALVSDNGSVNDLEAVSMA